MKPIVNLSGEPFRNRRLFWLAIFSVGVIATFGWLRSLGLLAGIDERIAARRPVVAALEARVKEVGADRGPLQTLERRDRAAYWAANDLILRKTFSWTHLLNDVERHIPVGVRVLRIGVSKERSAASVAAEGSGRKIVTLTMDVVAKNDGDVTGMIESFHRTGRFLATPKWQKPVEGITDIEFGIEIDYEPPVPEIQPQKPVSEPASTRKNSTAQVAQRR
jgi:hypothetical protein